MRVYILVELVIFIQNCTNMLINDAVNRIFFVQHSNTYKALASRSKQLAQEFVQLFAPYAETVLTSKST